MMRFDYEKNREEIEENANIVLALEDYIKSFNKTMDAEFTARYQKTLDKFKVKLAECHKAEKAYFKGDLT
jgi:hypothetical protein